MYYSVRPPHLQFIVFDYNGNAATEVTSSGTTTFVWDFENRLMSVTLPGGGGTVTFKYDPYPRPSPAATFFAMQGF